VSPNNKIPVHLSDSGLLQNEDRCPSGFNPRSNNSFLGKLTFSLAIGQAF
jgi:hypothetical protein